MNYTKDFEKYWSNAKSSGIIISGGQWKILKQIAFRAWKAGQRNIKSKQIKHLSESEVNQARLYEMYKANPSSVVEKYRGKDW